MYTWNEVPVSQNIGLTAIYRYVLLSHELQLLGMKCYA